MATTIGNSWRDEGECFSRGAVHGGYLRTAAEEAGGDDGGGGPGCT